MSVIEPKGFPNNDIEYGRVDNISFSPSGWQRIAVFKSASRPIEV